ncbi:MAG: CoA pyrophosphatase [Vicingaceae bacterium]|nr:CoA pyrophosphatase [Vicingaceae bacterium]
MRSYLQEKLNQKLPGKAAHIEAAPYRRVDFDKQELKDAKESGVLILFYIKESAPHIALMQRPTYDGKHSGQVSFPGGKRELIDETIIDTALREANEEVGIVIDDVDVIGQLSAVYIPVSNFHVSPVVGIVNYTPDFVIDNYEVEELIELKLSDLTGVKELELSKISLDNNVVLKTPSFIFNDKVVWGATALMLNELRWLLKEFQI